MAQQIQGLEEIVLTRVLRLNALVDGLVTGLVLAFAVFIATNWLVIKGGDVVGPHLSLLSNFFIGYHVSFAGSVIGFAYGFAAGFGLGYSVAIIYNWIVNFRENASRNHA